MWKNFALLNRKIAANCQFIENKNGGTFCSFHEQEIGKLLAKNIARTARRQLEGRHHSAIWRIFAKLNKKTKLAD